MVETQKKVGHRTRKKSFAVANSILPIQGKFGTELKKGQLNVVGENHDSVDRYEDICHIDLKFAPNFPPYYEEQEYQLNLNWKDTDSKNSGQTATSGIYIESGIAADSPYYRLKWCFEQLQVQIGHAVDDTKEAQQRPWLKHQASKRLQVEVAYTQKAIDKNELFDVLIKNMNVEYLDLQKQMNQAIEKCNNDVSFLLRKRDLMESGDLNVFFKHLENLKKLLSHLPDFVRGFGDYPGEIEPKHLPDYQKIADLIQLLRAEIQAFEARQDQYATKFSQKVQLVDAPIQNEKDNASFMRAKHMHLAASHHGAATAVWKIGERHVQEIEHMYGSTEPLAYNLIPLSNWKAGKVEEEASATTKRKDYMMYMMNKRKSKFIAASRFVQNERFGYNDE